MHVLPSNVVAFVVLRGGEEDLLDFLLNFISRYHYAHT